MQPFPVRFILSSFLEIFRYQFMIKAFILAGVLSVLCACIGMIIVLRRLSMVGDALAHASLAGVAFGLLVGINPVLGALGASLFAAFAVENLRKKFNKYSEISIAIILSSGIGLAGTISSFLHTSTSFSSFLFGSIVTVSNFEFYLNLVIASIVLFGFFFFYKELFFLSFDSEAARLAGVPVFWVNTLFTFFTAMTISIASRTIGSLIISSLLVLPIASALLLAKSYKQAIGFSIAISLFCSLSGVLASYYLDLRPGSTIVMISVSVLLLIFLVKRVLSCLISST